jgi:hypothetical protein
MLLKSIFVQSPRSCQRFRSALTRTPDRHFPVFVSGRLAFKSPNSCQYCLRIVWPQQERRSYASPNDLNLRKKQLRFEVKDAS